MFEYALAIGLIGIILVLVGLGVVAWLRSMTNTGQIETRGHNLGLW